MSGKGIIAQWLNTLLTEPMGERDECNDEGDPLECADPRTSRCLRARAAADPIGSRCCLPSGSHKGGHVRPERTGPLRARPTDLGSVYEPYEPRPTRAPAREARQARSACP